MSPRARRLYADHAQMVELAARGGVEFTCEGNPAEEYHVAFHRLGLSVREGRVGVRRLHRARVQLHLDYPRLPPVVTWQTPIFHPNILGPERHGGVCIGTWTASESLADLCVRLGRMVAYESFNATDALDTAAAEWTRQHALAEGDDLETTLHRIAA